MQTGNLEFILAWASILGAVLGGFGFLHRDMNKKFGDLIGDMNKKFGDSNGDMNKKFEGVNGTLKEHGEQFASLREGVARIEGYLGYGFAGPFGERRADDEPPERAA